MSDVISHYIVGTKRVPEVQYTSLRSALVITMQRQGWKVEQVIFITGARSLNEEERPVSMEPIRPKLDMKIFDEYSIILKGLYSIRCNGRSNHGGTSACPVHGRSDNGDTPA